MPVLLDERFYANLWDSGDKMMQDVAYSGNCQKHINSQESRKRNHHTLTKQNGKDKLQNKLQNIIRYEQRVDTIPKRVEKSTAIPNEQQVNNLKDKYNMIRYTSFRVRKCLRLGEGRGAERALVVNINAQTN